MKKTHDWFKLKHYPHVGFPLRKSERQKWIEDYVTNPGKIAKHAFLPFIHKTSRVRKFRKSYSSEDGKVIKESRNGNALQAYRYADEKRRELYYAGHLDSLIYSYYAQLLSEKYELTIGGSNVDEAVTAYRTVPKDKSKPQGPNKCNIDFALDVFNAIRIKKEDRFVVMTFDISSFFDRINHEQLRARWCDLLEADRMLEDHFNVFKHITRFNHVDIVDIFEEFQDRIFVSRIDPTTGRNVLKRKRVSRTKFLRNQEAVAFCTKAEFFKVKHRLIKLSKTSKEPDGTIVYRDFGIPQGSPISSVLANVYLLNFDRIICNHIGQSGLYRRYSDDMIIICNHEEREEIEQLIQNEIARCKLEIQKRKTQVFHFERKNGLLSCAQQFEKELNPNKNLIYLGFEFDGNRTLLKSASISAYYRKMKKAISRSSHYSSKRGSNTKGELFKRRLLKKHSYKGAKRYRKWTWNPSLREFEKSDYYNWGNFLSYAYKADRTIQQNHQIKKQLKGHWKRIHTQILKGRSN